MELALFGRRDIYSSVETIDETNILEVLNKALTIHAKNAMEMDYLYWYRRGMTPVLNRTKEVRPEICHRADEAAGHANEIVTFKNGYFLTQPAVYVARNDAATEGVKELNEFLYRSGKAHADNECVDWFHTVGKGYIYIKPNDDKKVPFKAYSVDPRSCSVVKSLKPGNEPLFAFYAVVDDKKSRFDVFTKDIVFHLSGADVTDVSMQTIRPNTVFSAVNIDYIEPNVLHEIPIIEYKCNAINTGAFEEAIPLLNAMSDVLSNRLDGIEQFIQSLAVAVNCQFEEGTTANDIRKAGMIQMKSTGENRADFRILSEQLDQTQTQVLVDYLYEQVLNICGVPGATKNSSSTSDTGVAQLARSGWYQADTYARNTEDLFRESNALFDKVMLAILRGKGLTFVDVGDFELKIARNETSNIQSKAQSFATLLQSGLHPVLAMEKSGVSYDPMSDFSISKPYFDLKLGNPDKIQETAMAEEGGNEQWPVEKEKEASAEKAVSNSADKENA